jgi:ribulose-phosphate 3-epimerase
MDDAKLQVSLSIWSTDQTSLADEIARYDSLADSFHVDVMDGIFADNLLYGPLTVESVRSLTKKPIVVHLMIGNPGRFVNRFVKAGASVLAVHPTACPDLGHTLRRIRDTGAGAAVAISLDESAQPAMDNLSGISQVLVMGTAIGVKGKDFDRAALERVSLFSQHVRGPEIFVDGGIRWSSVADISEAGADGVVAGSIITGASRPAEAARQIAEL